LSTLPAPKRRRTTAQRVVLEVLSAGDRFRSAQQIYLEIRSQRPVRIGLTSVYRILRGLSDDAVAETQRAEDGETLYRRRTGSVHRHYLVCRGCGRAVGFTPTALEEHTRQLSLRFDYTDVTHHVDLYGICPECRNGADELADSS
jgi:Fur family transcriptional regulator, ferric uptake regulator